MLKESKPPPKRLTSTKSDPGFESKFRARPFQINPGSDPDVCWIAAKIWASVISPSVVKAIGDYTRNATPKIIYSAMVREVEK